MTKTYLLTIIFLVSLISCNSNDGIKSPPPIDEGVIQADYIKDISVSNFRFITTPAGDIFYLGLVEKDNSLFSSLMKLSSTGETLTIDEIDSVSIGSFVDLAYSNNKILYTVYLNTGKSKLSSFAINDNTISAFEINEQSYYHSASITNYMNDTFIYSDYSVLRKYIPEQNISIRITDTNPLLEKINKMISVGNTIYMIESGKNLIKITDNGGELFAVTALIENNAQNISDITADDAGNVFLLIYGKGIYKLNSDNTLEEYLTGEFTVNDSSTATINSYGSQYGGLNSIQIINSDLYLYLSGSLIKISDYKSKVF